MDLLINTFVVFSITLLLTKAKILAAKRDFVEQRYEATRIANGYVGWIHRWWHAMWTCPMCAGFWVAIPVCLVFPFGHPFTDIMVVFGANWLMHCLENVMFYWSKIAETIDSANLDAVVKALNKTAQAIEIHVKKITKQIEQLSKSSTRLADKAEQMDIPTDKTFKEINRNLRGLNERK